VHQWARHQWARRPGGGPASTAAAWRSERTVRRRNPPGAPPGGHRAATGRPPGGHRSGRAADVTRTRWLVFAVAAAVVWWCSPSTARSAVGRCDLGLRSGLEWAEPDGRSVPLLCPDLPPGPVALPREPVGEVEVLVRVLRRRLALPAGRPDGVGGLPLRAPPAQHPVEHRRAERLERPRRGAQLRGGDILHPVGVQRLHTESEEDARAAARENAATVPLPRRLTRAAGGVGCPAVPRHRGAAGLPPWERSGAADGDRRAGVGDTRLVNGYTVEAAPTGAWWVRRPDHPQQAWRFATRPEALRFALKRHPPPAAHPPSAAQPQRLRGAPR
jgi:hypothetical protein